MEDYKKAQKFKRQLIMGAMMAAVVALIFLLCGLIRSLDTEQTIIEAVPTQAVVASDEKKEDWLSQMRGELSSEQFAELTGEKGEKIALSEVRAGDLAIGRGIVGLCVGFYDGKAVFSYSSDYAAYGVVSGGICLGYAREQSLELFFGMYPVAFEAYYRGEPKEDVGYELENAIASMKTVAWYVGVTYRIGLLMSACQAEELMRSTNTDYLRANNLTLDQDLFQNFLNGFAVERGVKGAYDLTIRSVYEADKYTEVSVGLIPLDEDGAFRCVGEWKLVLFKDKELILPCGIDVMRYSAAGIVRAAEIKLVSKDNGNSKMESVPIVYGQTVDENGKPIYRFDDGTVVYMEVEE